MDTNFFKEALEKRKQKYPLFSSEIFRKKQLNVQYMTQMACTLKAALLSQDTLDDEMKCAIYEEAIHEIGKNLG